MNEEQEAIVLENQKLIYMILKKYKLYRKCDEYFDLGMIGLCKGAKTFDKTKKFKLSTYLSKCIENEIRMYLRKKRPDTISLETKVNDDLTLETVIEDTTIDIERDLISKIDFERVNEVIKSLPEKEKIVMCSLFNINGYKKLTQEELANYLNTSQTQISRIKNKAISTLRKRLEDD